MFLWFASYARTGSWVFASRSARNNLLPEEAGWQLLPRPADERLFINLISQATGKKGIQQELQECR
jgi:hypothetical protein